MAVGTVSSSTLQNWQTIGTATTSSGTSVSLFSGITGYKRLLLTWSNVTSSASYTPKILFNGDSGANYSSLVADSTAGDTNSIILDGNLGGTKNGYILIDNVLETAPKLTSGVISTGHLLSGTWLNTSALTSITATSSVAFTGGTWTLYGIAG